MPDARPSLGAFYTATRNRTDLWRRLKTATEVWEADPDNKAPQEAIRPILEELSNVETYWAYPGKGLVARMRALLEDEDPYGLQEMVALVVRMLVSEAFRIYAPNDDEHEPLDDGLATRLSPDLVLDERPYFEVLVVDTLSRAEEEHLRERLHQFRADHDHFVYDIVVVPSYEDALIAVLLNETLQSVVIRYGFPVASSRSLGLAERAIAQMAAPPDPANLGVSLGSSIQQLRPTLDLYMVSDANVEDIAGSHKRLFRRIFFRQEDLRELHLSLLKGIQARFHTPFFTALMNYSRRPTGVFHALPIARGKSISRSHWIQEMEDLFGAGLFQAETSTTSAGLDSLLSPHGSLRDAQALAARAFGADRTFFVTNGTSTANKIVLQAVTSPGDLVLATRDCHMSHHYAFVLSGVMPVYMDPYPLQRFGFYGGVTLQVIKEKLLKLREAGHLHRTKVLLLTNCTFDGIVYNPLEVMEQVLAIHPGITFIWDEAWFAFAGCSPITRRRTAMRSASMLRQRIHSPGYRRRYAEWKLAFDADANPEKWFGNLMVDPDKARVRVYATHSTHKTLTSLRQGSMIHVRDQDYGSCEEAFHQAYLSHTSSSANYPILASLDIGRRQVELEGYELVNHAIELAMVLRTRINNDPHLSRWFKMLSPEDLIPEALRPSGFTRYTLKGQVDWERMDEAWESDAFCVDPTRLTLFIGNTGIDGDTFKAMLIEDYDIQVNKTSVNTVLFMTHIGTTRGAAAHLIDVLSTIAERLTEDSDVESPRRADVRSKKREMMTGDRCALPDFSRFHPLFRDPAGLGGDIRRAFFLSMNEANIRFISLDDDLGPEEGPYVAGCFVTPYPPGFPVLVPGQELTVPILEFLRSVRRTEIHGYDPELGLRILTKEALQ